MSKKDGHQKGAQQHAEGQQGEKTRSRQKEILHGAATGATDTPPQPTHDPHGGHRLGEDRQQHDEAEKNSEKNRAADVPPKSS